MLLERESKVITEQNSWKKVKKILTHKLLVFSHLRNRLNLGAIFFARLT